MGAPKRSSVAVVCFVLGAVGGGTDSLGCLAVDEGLAVNNPSSSDWLPDSRSTSGLDDYSSKECSYIYMYVCIWYGSAQMQCYTHTHTCIYTHSILMRVCVCVWQSESPRVSYCNSCLVLWGFNDPDYLTERYYSIMNMHIVRGICAWSTIAWHEYYQWLEWWTLNAMAVLLSVNVSLLF